MWHPKQYLKHTNRITLPPLPKPSSGVPVHWEQSPCCRSGPRESAPLPRILLLPTPSPRLPPLCLQLAQLHARWPASWSRLSGSCLRPQDASVTPRQVSLPCSALPSWPCCPQAVRSEGTSSADQPPPSLGVSI